MTRPLPPGEPVIDAPLNTRLHAVSEVRMEIADYAVPQTLAFWREVFELLPWPLDRNPPGAVGIGPTRRGLLLTLAHDPRPDPRRRRIVLVVDSLEVLAQRLASGAMSFERTRGVFATDDAIVVLDPTGNRIEIRQFRSI